MHFNTTYPTPQPIQPLPDPAYPSYSQYLDHHLLSHSPSDSAANPDTETWPIDALTHHLENPTAATPLDAFMAGKGQNAARTATELLGLMYERQTLKYDHHRRIDYESCQIGTRLLPIKDWATGLDPGIDKTRSQLERELIGFEREKRMEEIACWRDTLRLKTELGEALAILDNEKRKQDLLGGPDGRT